MIYYAMIYNMQYTILCYAIIDDTVERISPVALAAVMGMSVFTGSTRVSGMPPFITIFVYE